MKGRTDGRAASGLGLSGSVFQVGEMAASTFLTIYFPSSDNTARFIYGCCPNILRSVDLWIKGCVKSRAFLLCRACFPSPSAQAPASQRTVLSTDTSSSVDVETWLHCTCALALA